MRGLTAMANFSPTHARTPPPKGTQASGFTAAASGVPSKNLSGMNSSGACRTAGHHSLLIWLPRVMLLLQHGTQATGALPDMHGHAACCSHYEHPTACVKRTRQTAAGQSAR